MHEVPVFYPRFSTRPAKGSPTEAPRWGENRINMIFFFLNSRYMCEIGIKFAANNPETKVNFIVHAY